MRAVHQASFRGDKTVVTRRLTDPYWSSADDETLVREQQGRIAWWAVGLAAAVIAGVSAFVFVMLSAFP